MQEQPSINQQDQLQKKANRLNRVNRFRKRQEMVNQVKQLQETLEKYKQNTMNQNTMHQNTMYDPIIRHVQEAPSLKQSIISNSDYDAKLQYIKQNYDLQPKNETVIDKIANALFPQILGLGTNYLTSVVAGELTPMSTWGSLTKSVGSLWKS